MATWRRYVASSTDPIKRTEMKAAQSGNARTAKGRVSQRSRGAIVQTAAHRRQRASARAQPTVSPLCRGVLFVERADRRRHVGNLHIAAEVEEVVEQAKAKAAQADHPEVAWGTRARTASGQRAQRRGAMLCLRARRFLCACVCVFVWFHLLLFLLVEPAERDASSSALVWAVAPSLLLLCALSFAPSSTARCGPWRLCLARRRRPPDTSSAFLRSDTMAALTLHPQSRISLSSVLGVCYGCTAAQQRQYAAPQPSSGRSHWGDALFQREKERARRVFLKRPSPILYLPLLSRAPTRPRLQQRALKGAAEVKVVQAKDAAQQPQQKGREERLVADKDGPLVRRLLLLLLLLLRTPAPQILRHGCRGADTERERKRERQRRGNDQATELGRAKWPFLAAAVCTGPSWHTAPMTEVGLSR